MDTNSLKKALLLMLVIVTIALVSWELRLRKIGVQPTFDAGEVLWSDKRAMVYEPKDKVTVFIGSSRIHFDIDIPTWQADKDWVVKTFSWDHVIESYKNEILVIRK